MKKIVALSSILLCVTGLAMGDYQVAAGIYYPDATSWQLYLREADTAGTVGYGIAGFAITVHGASIGPNSWVDGDFAQKGTVKAGTITKGTLGWATTGGTEFFPDSNNNGYLQLMAGIDLQNWQNIQTYGYGQQAGGYQPGQPNVPSGTFTPTSTWKINGVSAATWSYLGPQTHAWDDATGAYDGPALPFSGVCVWAGLRDPALRSLLIVALITLTLAPPTSSAVLILMA